MNYSKDTAPFDRIFSELRYHPNQHLVEERLLNYAAIPVHSGFFFESALGGDVVPFMEVNGKLIDKITLEADLGFFEPSGKHLAFILRGFSIEVYVLQEEAGSSGRPVIMGLDELNFFTNLQRNEEAKIQFGFPILEPCELSPRGFDYITEGRRIQRAYFHGYSGPALHLYFRNELTEIFAVTSNNLAFLYRNKARVFEEIELLHNTNYGSPLWLYPRFNNAIAEVAGGLYNFWERIAFVLNEFFPTDPLSSRLPSFNQYFNKMEKRLPQHWKTGTYYWFFQRLTGENNRIGELRHSMVNYDKNGKPSGMRSADLIQRIHENYDTSQLEGVWSDELSFLKTELGILSVALEKMWSLIEEWAAMPPI